MSGSKTPNLKRKVVFLDRDGTINEDSGYITRPSEFVFLNGAVEALKILVGLGYDLVVVTNQGGIARGLYTVEDMNSVHAHMEKLLLPEGVRFLRISYCPHHHLGEHPEYGVACECRKPKPGMLQKAISELGIDPAISWMVGDKVTDVQAGLAVQVRSVYVGPKVSHEALNAAAKFKRLLDFAEWLKNAPHGSKN